MAADTGTARARTVIPLIDAGAEAAAKLRRRSLTNLSCMGHCAPTVMQTLLEASGIDAPWLVRASGGLPGGIGNTGGECGGVTAPLMLLGMRHARDPLDRGVPIVVHKAHDLLQRFTECHGTSLCREIRRTDRLPWRCVGVVRHAPESYAQALTRPRTDAIPAPSRRAFARLHAHFVEQGFQCAHTVLAPLQSALPVDDALLDAASGFVGGTAFTGRTCGALTAGILALSAAVGGIEHNRVRVLRMIGLMAVGGDAFADNRNAFNKAMNLGQRLARAFAQEFGSTQCAVLTQCGFSTMEGVDSYIARGQVTGCRHIAQRVGAHVRDLVESQVRAALT